MVCSCMVAQNLSSPLLSAAISWNPLIRHNETSSQLHFPVATDGSNSWNGFQVFPEGRYMLVLNSMNKASQSWPISPEGGTITTRRLFPQREEAPINSTINNLRVPFLMVDKLEWVTDYEATLDEKLMKAVRQRHGGYLNISDDVNPMAGSVIGNAALLKDTPWRPAPVKFQHSAPEVHVYEFPPPIAFNDDKYVAVVVTRLDHIKENEVCPPTSRRFGQLPEAKQLNITYYRGGKPFGLQCYIFAKVTLRAGSYKPKKSTVVLSGVAEAVIPSNDSNLNQDFADPLVLPVFDTMPEVMRWVSVMNSTKFSPWNNLDGYIRGMLMLTYQATWNVMADEFQSETVEAEIFFPEYMIAIEIEHEWFIAWLVVIYAAVISGLCFIWISTTQEEAGAVDNPALSAIRLDPTNIYERIPTLCSSAKLSKNDEKVMLRFAKPDMDGCDSSYNHGISSSVHYGHQETGVCRFGMLDATSEDGNEDDRSILLRGFRS